MLLILLQTLAKVPVHILGWFIVPFMWFFREVPYEKMRNSLLAPWVNPEDWTGGYRNFPPEYNCVPRDIYDGKQGFLQFYLYHAFRNGADGLRNFEWHLCRYDHDKMHIVYDDGTGYNFTIRQGKYVSIQRRYGKHMLKVGWRMNLRDIREGYDPKSIRWNHGSSVASSFRKIWD